MTDDAELLRRYAEENAEEAFAELVRRHLGLVYHAALRQCGGDAHRAEDVAQTVFTDLARKAEQLARREGVAGWLYTSTRYAAAQAVRGEVRRQRREQEAHAMNEILAKANGEDAAAAEWERMRPVIDEALHALPEHDREAVLARFFEGKAFAEIGARLRLSEDAARMRVERALEKLRGALGKRGVNSTVAALGIALANQATAAVPAGLAASVTGAALAGAGAVVGGIFTFMSATKITMGVVVAVALATVGATIYEAEQVTQRDERLAEATRQQTALRAKVANLEARLSAESGRAQAAEADSAKLLAAVENFKKGMGAKAVEASTPLTREAVEGRFTRALQLAKSGQHAEALKEFIWCHDEGMVRVTSLYGERIGALRQIAALGARYPEALEFLRERRDAAEKRVLLFKNDAEAGGSFGLINDVLNEKDRTFAAYDQSPRGSADRMRLGTHVYGELIERRRYQDALEAMPFGTMVSLLDSWVKLRERAVPGTMDAQKVRYDGDKWIERAARNVEVLAGAGDLVGARSLATRLLAADGTEKARGLLQQRLERAGQPGLLTGVVAGGK